MSEHTLSKEQNWGIFSIQKERSLSMSALPLVILFPIPWISTFATFDHLKLSSPVYEILVLCKKKLNQKIFIYVCAFANERKWRIFSIQKELSLSMFAMPHLLPFTSTFTSILLSTFTILTC